MKSDYGKQLAIDEKKLRAYAEGISSLLEIGGVVNISCIAMPIYEAGRSGAELFRMECTLASNRKISFVCKKAELKERMVMHLLTQQDCSCTPMTYCDDYVTNAPVWMTQQDLGRRIPAPCNNKPWMMKVARGLAEIHANNMAQGDQLSWLPRADTVYWQRIVNNSLGFFENEVCTNPLFAKKYESVVPRLQKAGMRFVKEMTSLCDETAELTLTHGDLKNENHIFSIENSPYFIDFGFSRYAPFYIDVGCCFSLESASLYQRALADKGFSINYKDFEERFRIAYKYPAFLYMFSSIMNWKKGFEENLRRFLSRILDD